jgi:dipeptidyl aminopeptidase/acylaminoacyl peptidase
MRPADIAGLVAAGDPVLAPDGRVVAFVVTTVDVEANTYRQRIWVGPTDGSRPPEPFTTGDRSDQQPCFSPDGRRLAFTSRRGADEKHATLHVAPVAGPGETVTVATMKEAITELAWSPDGRTIAFSCRTPDPRYEIADERKQPARRITHLYARLDNEGWTFDRPRHVYVVAADGTGLPRNLTPGPHEFGSPAWGPDSSWLVAAGREGDEWDLTLERDLYRVALDGGAPQRLTPHDGSYQAPSVSPDGRHVAFLGHADALVYPQNVRLGVLDLATGTRTWLADSIDRTKTPFSGTRAPIWAGDQLLFALEDRGNAHVYAARPDAPAAEPTLVVGGSRMVYDFDHADGTTAFASGATDRPAEVFVQRDGSELRLSYVTDEFCARVRPRAAERFTAPSTGGAEVDVWLFTPPDLDPTHRYPALLNIHGGPFTQYGNGFFDEAQLQAGAGFVVIMANPRGSSGRDTAWGRAIAGPKSTTLPGTGWGSVDADDVTAAVDEAIRRYPFIDPGRVGVLGGSYGGYLTSWLVSHTDRFKAACSERAVNNLLSEEWTSDIATAFRTELGVDHLTDPDEYIRVSPITYAADIHTPLLIVHSENDLRCPIEQAEQLFIALRMRRQDVEFVRFPAEGHELSRSGSPAHRIERAEIILDWFTRKL